MIVVALADLHGDTDQLSRIADDMFAADLILLLGDLTHFGRRSAAQRVLRDVREYNLSVLAVHGNCDRLEVSDVLEEQDIDLHAQHKELEGISFVGLGGSLACPTRTPSEYTDDELRTLLVAARRDVAPGARTILVSHQPPANTSADLATIGRHVGSHAVRKFIERTSPLACFTGHIHEGRSIDRVGDCWIVNPGPLRNGGYAYAEIVAEDVQVEVRDWHARG